jgi:hypothetical protein
MDEVMSVMRSWFGSCGIVAGSGRRRRHFTAASIRGMMQTWGEISRCSFPLFFLCSSKSTGMNATFHKRLYHGVSVA